MAFFLTTVATTLAAGVVGLGVYGIRVARRRRNLALRRRRKNYLHHRRQQRSSKNSMALQNLLEEEEEEDESIERVMEAIRTQDVSGCGLRLVCELASWNHQNVGFEEAAILDLVGPPLKTRPPRTKGGGLLDYKTAKYHGEQGLNCSNIYQSCPFNAPQLMQLVLAHLP